MCVRKYVPSKNVLGELALLADVRRSLCWYVGFVLRDDFRSGQNIPIHEAARRLDAL